MAGSEQILQLRRNKDVPKGEEQDDRRDHKGAVKDLFEWHALGQKTRPLDFDPLDYQCHPRSDDAGDQQRHNHENQQTVKDSVGFHILKIGGI